MKTVKTLSLICFFLTSMIIYSCGRNKSSSVVDDQLGRIEVEVPNSLKDKPEVVSYIHDMNRVVDDYAMLIDQVLSDFKDFEDKDTDKMGMMDKIKFMKVSSEVGLKSMEIISQWGDYHNRANIFIEDLSGDETAALESVLKRFEDRMKQIERKHAGFFKEDK